MPRSPSRWLVVDDSPHFVRRVTQALTDAGAEVVGTAQDGLQALERFDLLEPDALSLDLGMPKMDGLAVAAAIRERERRRGGSAHCLIVMLTLHAEPAFRDQAHGVGVDRFLNKDRDFDELAGMVDLVRIASDAAGAAGEPREQAMSQAVPSARVLLLVEDNPGDADLAREMLAVPTPSGEAAPSSIVVVSDVAAAIGTLAAAQVDVVILDLSLPDCVGVATVSAIRAATTAPIIVLTGGDDEALAMSCIEAGAQDYLLKSEARPRSLQRAIGYTLARARDAQLQQMQQTLVQFRSLSSAEQGTSVTAMLAGSGAVARRNPAVFAGLIDSYGVLLSPHDRRNPASATLRRRAKEHVVTMLGDASGGPRDLLDLHVAALDQAMSQVTSAPAPHLVFEARMVVLEMMGLLVDYYRVGLRRRNSEGNET